KLGTLKLEYRTADMQAGQWVVVDTKPQLSGHAGFPATGTGAITVRLTIADEAENVGSNQVEVGAAAPPIGIPIPTTAAGAGSAADSGSPFSAHPVAMVRDQTPPKLNTQEPSPTSTAPAVLPPPGSPSGAAGAIAAT